MIYTVTLNPSLDYIMDVENDIEIGQTNRSKSEKIIFGGKGINVSYILKELETESVALGFVAGFTGRELVSLTRQSGINSRFTELSSGITRINVKLRSDTVTEINACGISVTERDVERLAFELSEIKSGDILVLSGSIPKDAPTDILDRIISTAKKNGATLMVDMSGKALLDALAFHPQLVKPNVSELSQAVKMQIDSESTLLFAAEKLQSMGAKDILVSMGEQGAMLLCEDGRMCRAASHKIKVINTVGAGDSTLAGYIVGMKNGEEYALKLAMAAGAATAASQTLATKDEILSLIKE